ncbi:unnamed protein product [Peniophora sp. CBMAI 1063]|nr:unnamed protein product [Peniophora sp. CBMAI 1063]
MIPISCNAVGDILALATLFLDIARALDESRGSPAKWRALNSELKSLHIVLASVARVAEHTTDTLLHDEIVREVNRCSDDVRRALERVAEFSMLGRDESPDDVCSIRMKRQWYKLKWRFCYHGSAESIRAELAAATHRLTAYLVVSNADKIHSLGASITEQFTATSAQICTLLLQQFEIVAMRDAGRSRTVNGHIESRRGLQLSSQSTIVPPGFFGNVFNDLDSGKAAAAALLCLAICTVHGTSRELHSLLLVAAFGVLMSNMKRETCTISSDVGYGQSNSVLLDDAMGRQLVLPIELCATVELLHATLVSLFSSTSGFWFIHSRNYRIQTIYQDGCRSLLPLFGDEPQLDGPYVKLVMAVAIWDNNLRVVCPICQSSGVASWVRFLESLDNDHSMCSYCQQTVFFLPCGVLYDYGAEFDDKKVVFPLAKPTFSVQTQTARPGKFTPEIGASRSTLRHTGATESITRRPHLDWKSQIKVFRRIYLCSTDGPLDSLREQSTDFHMAALNGHYDIVCDVLERGIDVNLADPSGHTALHSASMGGHLTIVELLLDYGAVVNVAAVNSLTPVACALACMKFAVAELLISRDALSGLSPPSQATILYYAAMSGHIQVVQIMLSLGTDVNTRVAIARGETALHSACENGADIRACSDTGVTPISIAIENWDRNWVEFLVPPGDMDSILLNWTAWWPSEGVDLLEAAIDTNLHKLIETLLQTGVDVNLWFHFGHTPLTLAISNWLRYETATLLLERGADVNAPTRDGDTPLFLALSGVKRHIDYIGSSSEEWSRWAAEAYQRLVQLLLAWGAILDEKSSMLLQEQPSWSNKSLGGMSDADIPGAWHEDP